MVGLHAADKQAVGRGLILEYTIPPAKHHTFIIILTTDCLTLIMKQQIQAEVMLSGSPSHGSVPSMRAHS